MAVSILQRCTNRKNFVYRQFRVDITMEQSSGYVPEIFTMETYRRIFDIMEAGQRIHSEGYEWGCFRNIGIKRWCTEGSVNHGGWLNGSGGYGYARSVLYTGNISRLF